MLAGQLFISKLLLQLNAIRCEIENWRNITKMDFFFFFKLWGHSACMKKPAFPVNIATTEFGTRDYDFQIQIVNSIEEVCRKIYL